MNADSLKFALSRPIAYYKSFVTITGSIGSAIMLSQALYWSERTNDEDGWFWKTREDWEAETGLKRPEQENARQKLLASGVWKEELRGVPAKMWFRIDFEALTLALQGHLKPLTLDQVLEINKSTLISLSKAGHMRAIKAKVNSVYTSYADVLKVKGMVCGICGKEITKGVGQKEGFLVFDHIIPITKGGEHSMNNLQPAHAECNGKKCGDYPVEPCEPTSLLTVSQLECLPKANKKVYGKPTSEIIQSQLSNCTETTSETTSDIKRNLASKPNLIDQVKQTLNSMFKRLPNDRWSYEEESNLVVICKRPNLTNELKELAKFKDESEYFPQSISSLLNAWQPTLDRARNQKPKVNGCHNSNSENIDIYNPKNFSRVLAEAVQ